MDNAIGNMQRIARVKAHNCAFTLAGVREREKEGKVGIALPITLCRILPISDNACHEKEPVVRRIEVCVSTILYGSVDGRRHLSHFSHFCRFNSRKFEHFLYDYDVTSMAAMPCLALPQWLL